MQRNETVRLGVQAGWIPDAKAYLLAHCRNRSVLNVGAAGNVEYYLPQRKHLWLHAALADTAADLVGVDVDAESVGYAERAGVHLVLANCETMRLDRCFDVVVLSEVIEHLDAPGMALKNLMAHLNPGGKLLITTPNPSYYGFVVRTTARLELNIYYDHVVSFYPENLVAMCNRHGYRMTDLKFFSWTGTGPANIRIKSWMARNIGKVFHRLNNSFLVAIEAA